MSRQVARTLRPPRSRTTHQFCQVSSKPPHTACRCPRALLHRLAPQARPCRLSSPPRPAFSCCGPQWRLLLLLPSSPSPRPPPRRPSPPFPLLPFLPSLSFFSP